MSLDASRYNPFLKRGGTYGTADLGDSSVDSDEIVPGAVDTADIADSQITETKMAGSVMKIITGSFNMANKSASYFFYEQNPESSTIYVTDVQVEVTTAGGGAGTMDVGTHMTTGGSCDGMYVGKNMNTTGIYSIAGTSTGSILKVTSSTGYVIGDLGSGTSGNAAGTYRITYHT